MLSKKGRLRRKKDERRMNRNSAFVQTCIKQKVAFPTDAFDVALFRDKVLGTPSLRKQFNG